MMENNRVGRTWVQISLPAKNVLVKSPSNLSTFVLLLYNIKIMHLCIILNVAT